MRRRALASLAVLTLLGCGRDRPSAADIAHGQSPIDGGSRESDAGAGAIADAGTGTGADAGAELAADAGAGTAADAGAELAADAGAPGAVGVDGIAADRWTPLFNGHSLAGWTSWLGSQGRGKDPKGIFRVDPDGSLHVLGLAATSQSQDFGYLLSNGLYSQVRVRLQQRWGTARFTPRADQPRDSGLLYHVRGADQVWPQCLEFQILEHGTGDLWMLSHTRIRAPAKTGSGDPRYAEGLDEVALTGGRLQRSEEREALTGWNRLELILQGTEAAHVVNGARVNRASTFEYATGASWEPLERGHLALQAEGAEVFYRNVEVRGLPFTPPPPGATVLFDGTDAGAWKGQKGGAEPWPVTDGALEVCPGCGDLRTRAGFEDVRLHVEFRVPFTPPGHEEQDHGNSGVYLQGRYEVQILDSWGQTLSGADDSGAIYGVRNASTNEALPAETWQAYDIVFRAPRWDGAIKRENARVSVTWNGVEVQRDVEVPGPTRLGDPEAPGPAPLRLQDHGHRVKFRNIWLQPLAGG